MAQHLNVGTKVVRKKPKRRAPGRPPYQPTDLTHRQVEQLAMMGKTYPEIAEFMGIHVETLRKYYRETLDKVAVEKNYLVIENLFNIATSKDHKSAAAAAMFWAKTRLGWREVTRVENTGPDGGPMQLNVSTAQVLDASKMTPEERDALRTVLESAIASKTAALAYNHLDEANEAIDADYSDADEDDGEEE